MDEQGLWRLFFATGLPQAYLAVRGVRRERERPLSRTAFSPGREGRSRS